MLLCFQIRVNFTLVLCIACYHFEFGIAVQNWTTLKPLRQGKFTIFNISHTSSLAHFFLGDLINNLSIYLKPIAITVSRDF